MQNISLSAVKVESSRVAVKDIVYSRSNLSVGGYIVKYQSAELKKLEQMLEEAGIRFRTVTLPSSEEDENRKILLYFGTSGVRVGFGLGALSTPNRKCSVINYGHGSENGLLEMSGLCSLLTNSKAENDGSSCVGNLSAEDVFHCIKTDWETFDIEIENGVLMHMHANGNVRIPDGVLEIGKNALTGYIESVVVPRGVTKIHDLAFSGQWDLQYIKLPSSICEIAENAFEGVDDEYFYMIVPKDSYAAHWAKRKPHFFRVKEFYEYHLLEDGEVVFNQAIEKITDDIFSKSDAALIKKICIPEGVTEIDDAAFYSCKNIESVTFPSTLKRIRAWFECNERLKNVQFSYGNTEIDDNAFFLCGIENVVIPGSITRVGDSAFACCPIRHLEIEQGVEVIGENAFMRTNLSEVIIPKSVNSIGTDAFSNNQNEPIPIINE